MTTEIEKIEAALKAAAARVVDEYRKRDPEEPSGDIGQAIDEYMAWIKADGWRTDPRKAVYELGERIHAIGGLDLMTKILDRVAAAADEDETGLVEDILDKTWDGIGRTETSAGWCA
jgi:hypothetical protein